MIDLDPPHSRSLTILNMSGDSTLTWSPKTDAVMRQIIERKLQEGWAFWILKPRLAGFLPDRKIKVRTLEQAMESRSLSMDDDDFIKLITEGGVQLVSTPERAEGWTDDAVQSKDPADIAVSNAIGVRNMSGG
ncbi:MULTISPECIES: hypothetical protein [unclassified Bradyrhizobium]